MYLGFKYFYYDAVLPLTIHRQTTMRMAEEYKFGCDEVRFD